MAVEADVTDGMPQFEMVGFLSSEVKEARERVRTALRNSGFRLPAKKITVNLTPSDLRKSGNSYDLPIAAAVLASFGYLDADALRSWLLIGEVGLDGTVLPVHGVLPAAILASSLGCKGIVVPEENAREAAVFPGIQVLPVKNISHLTDVFMGGLQDTNFYQAEPVSWKTNYAIDFSEVRGQRMLMRAAEIAAAGMHNLLMIGPPGAGKTMIASRIPTILPLLTQEEKLEISRIYSIAGLLDESGIIRNERPFRAPHHTITAQAMMGGGKIPKPGEVSLAHHGVLFLDELPEFQKYTLEALREPLEDRIVRISRVGGCFTYPAGFLLLAAMNPCPCGYYPDLNRCTCTAYTLQRYQNRISQPLLDRIDLCAEAEEIGWQDLTVKEPAGSSAAIRKRVEAAHLIQTERFRDTQIRFNSRIPSSQIKTWCYLEPALEADLERHYKKEQLTVRAYYKILRVARTIADLDHSERIREHHLEEAFIYRSIDKKYWRRY